MLHEMDMKALWDNLDHVDMELHSEVNKLNTIRENMNNLRESLEEENERYVYFDTIFSISQSFLII